MMFRNVFVDSTVADICLHRTLLDLEAAEHQKLHSPLMSSDLTLNSISVT